MWRTGRAGVFQKEQGKDIKSYLMQMEHLISTFLLTGLLCPHVVAEQYTEPMHACHMHVCRPM